MVPEADVLIVEATFGRPRYRFPPAATVMENLLEFCRRTLEEGRAAGAVRLFARQGPEILARLAGAGFDIAVHAPPSV